VVKVLSFSPDDPTIMSTLYVTNDTLLKSKCDFDYDAGQGPMDAYVGAGWGFRIVLSELIEGDEVEALDDAGIGTEAYPGFVQITTPDGATVTSTVDPTLQLTPDTLSSIYQPAGGSGCFDTVETLDIYTYAPNPGPAILTYLAGVPSLPSNTTLTLWLKKDNGGRKVVDTGGTQMTADFKVDFTTEPMFVDCPALDACNVMPSLLPDDQPVDPLDPDMGFDMVTVQLTAPIGDPSGVFLYDAADPTQPVADVVPEIDAYIADSLWGGMPNAVSLIKGTADAREPIEFTPGATYWIVVTDAVLDAWGVKVEMFPDDTSCDDLATAGIDVTNCVWAGTFTVADAV
jgi:hypothetical protein